MKMMIYTSLAEKKKQGKKSFGVLIDPDKVNTRVLDDLIKLSLEAGVDYFLVGGSLVISNQLDECVQHIKRNCSIPVVLFPGSPSQVSRYADALLYLSLISGRNPELLIGQHVVSAPFVKQSGLEIIPTGYIVVDGGAPTTGVDECANFLFFFHLPIDELNDLGVIEVEANHLCRTTSGAAALDSTCCPVADFEEAHQSAACTAGAELFSFTAYIGKVSSYS